MNIKVVYPAKNIRRDLRRNAIYYAKLPFVFAGIISIIVNLHVGGSAWSAIVVWSLLSIWHFFFVPTLIGHNRTSMAVKTTINITILIVIIYLVYPDWPGIEVASLCLVAGLIVSAVLFFSNISRQKQNVFPLILFSIIALIFGTIAFIFRQAEPLGWTFIVAISLALAIFLSTAIILRVNYLKELKKRFLI